MNEIVNKFLLTGEKFMPEMHDLLIVHVGHLLKIKNEFKNLKKEEYELYLQKRT